MRAVGCKRELVSAVAPLWLRTVLKPRHVISSPDPHFHIGNLHFFQPFAFPRPLRSKVLKTLTLKNALGQKVGYETPLALGTPILSVIPTGHKQIC